MGSPLPGYEEEIINSVDVLSMETAANIHNCGEGCLKSDAERACRRDIGTSPTSASEASIQYDHRALIEKTEKLKKDVMGLLESFSQMLLQLEPAVELADLHLARHRGESSSCTESVIFHDAVSTPDVK